MADPPLLYLHAASLLSDGLVLVTGQEQRGNYLGGAWIYFPGENRWEYAAEATEFRRRGHTSTVLPSGRVLIARGTQNQIGGRAEVYDHEGWTLSVVGNDSPTTACTATLLQSGQVLVVGGSSQEEPELYSSAELFTEP